MTSGAKGWMLRALNKRVVLSYYAKFSRAGMEKAIQGARHGLMLTAFRRRRSIPAVFEDPVKLVADFDACEAAPVTQAPKTFQHYLHQRAD